MSKLLEVYDGMLKQAAEQDLVNQQIEFLAKYASAAEQLLQAEYPNDFRKQDVAELADALISHDVKAVGEQEKVAALEEIGRDLAREYVKSELEKDALFGGSVMSDAADFAKKHGKKGMKALEKLLSQGGEAAEGAIATGRKAWNNLSTAGKVGVGATAVAVPAAAVAGGVMLSKKK